MSLVYKLASGAAAAAMALAIGAATPAVAQEALMKIAHVANSNMRVHEGLLVWDAYIKRNLKGKIKTELFPNGQLGNFNQLVEQARLGTLECTFTTGGGISNVLPEIQVFDIPYMVKDDRVVELMQMDPIMQDEMRKDALAKTGLRLIGLGSTGGWRSFYTRNGPLKGAEGLKGVKIRTIESALPMEHVRALGGSPTPVPWQELYTAFATRVVDGTMNSVTDILAMNFNEFLKHGVLDRHTYLWTFWWVNEGWWQKLPTDAKEGLLNGFWDMVGAANALTKFNDIIDVERFVKGGGAIHSPTADEYKTFLPAREAATKWYVGKYGDKWLNMMNAAIVRAEKSIDEDNKRRM
ncbi:MAG: hypothetical protein EXQ96_02555 [Alphaproteobacteria bacterium]|nr:hypothetical protein [Alphaproteobacteria bacterium]